MCGIAGKIDFQGNHEPCSTALMWRIVQAIRHRGPDEFGGYRDRHAALLSARLSIIDIVGGQQPMTNEDETLWVAFNGEIYNYVELRNVLEKAGHRFRTKSDTEVILHAYEEWGTECFKRFNGQWAIALWNPKDLSLTLCRDRMGIRPLFVYREGHRVWFGSEIKAIFADPAVPRNLDPHGIAQVFRYWAPIAPISGFVGVEELLPGSFRQYGPRGEFHEGIYWSLQFPSQDHFSWKKPYSLSCDDAASELKELLKRATELRMTRSDVPVGSYLSGGLDSSLIAGLGSDASNGEFRTYSIRFEDAEFDETKYQRMMSSILQNRHEEVVASMNDISAVFPSVVWHTERPILRTAPAPLFMLSKQVNQAGIKAVLTGEGADEILGGYDIFREAKIRQFWSKQPESSIRPRLLERLYPYLARSPKQTKMIALEYWRQGLDRDSNGWFSHYPRWRSTSALQRYFSKDLAASLEGPRSDEFLRRLPEEFEMWEPLAQAQYLEIATLFTGYIISSQGDRMAMAHSVEGRFPFLDVNVVEFCNSLPSEYKLKLLNEKYLLKMVARGVVPREIIERQKQPYRAPDIKGLLTLDGPDYVHELFSESSLKDANVFNPRLAAGLYRKCREALQKGGWETLFSNSDNMAFVGILSTGLVYSQFIRQPLDIVASPEQFTVFFDRTIRQA